MNMNETDEKREEESDKKTEPDYGNQDVDSALKPKNIPPNEPAQNEAEVVPVENEYKTIGILCCRKRVKIAKSCANTPPT